MDGIVAVQNRIAQLDQRIKAITQPPAATTPGGMGVAAPTNGAATAAGPGPTSFEQLLRQATNRLAPGAATAGETGGLTPAELRPAGSYPRLEPPSDLKAFGNGTIPASALQPIGGGHMLERNAADAFTKLRDAATAAGIHIGITDSYRDLSTQHDLVRRKGLYSAGGLAAAPGTSNHGWGLSVDLDLDATAQTWMRENGHRFGYVEDVPREPWHWTYRPA